MSKKGAEINPVAQGELLKDMGVTREIQEAVKKIQNCAFCLRKMALIDECAHFCAEKVLPLLTVANRPCSIKGGCFRCGMARKRPRL